MEKKHISIIGACTSRNLFNSCFMKELFDVDCYVFQRCTWDFFGESLNIPKEDIFGLNIPEFTARMLWYALDKVTIQQLEKAKSEYLLIDLHQIRATVFKVQYNGKTVYMQRTGNNDPNIIEELKKNPKYSNIIVEKVEPDEELIKSGLSKLAEWVKSHYDESKVIIHFCKNATKFRKYNEIYDFNELQIKRNAEGLAIVEKYTNFLKDELKNAVYIEDGNEIVAIYNENDSLKDIQPPSEHLSGLDNINISLNLVNKTIPNLSYEKNYILEKEYDFLEQKYYNQIIDFNDIKKYILNINNYFSNIQNLQDYIVVISVKDEASTNSKYFRAKSLLGLKFNVGYRSSYIAIVDKSNNFVYEDSSQEKINYNYAINDTFINIQSAGFNCGSYSKIIIDGVDYSPNKRGLNIVLIRKKDFVVVEKIRCDFLAGKDLFIEKFY